MSLLSKLGLTYDDSENQEVKPETKQNDQPVSTGDKPVEEKKPLFVDLTPQTVPGQVVGEVDPKVYQALSEAIEKANLPGNDFLEFMMALNNLTAMVLMKKVNLLWCLQH